MMDEDRYGSAIVAAKRCCSYYQKDVDEGVAAIFDLMGGIERFIKEGDKVLLKPNLLAPGHPDKARTTHPSVVVAVANCVRQAGGTVCVGDSPAIKAARLVAMTNGLLKACRQHNIPFVEFRNSVEKKNLQGRLVKSFQIAKEVAEADLVINIPKIKTHSLTTITCAVKNNFGCIVGLSKGQYHVKFDNAYMFSTMLLDLYQCLRPGLTIIDGIVSMAGKDGPVNGKPVRTGMLLAGTDCVALDIYLCHVLGIDVETVRTNNIAIRNDYGVTDISKMTIVGDNVAYDGQFDYCPTDRSPAWLLPGWVTRELNNRLSARPHVNDRCMGCGDCAKICPVGAVTAFDGKQRIDMKKCIRCYCCQEVCRYSAVDLIKPFWGKWLGF